MLENSREREVSVDEAWDRLLPTEYPEKETLENIKNELSDVSKGYLERLKNGEEIKGVDSLKKFLGIQKDGLQGKIDEVVSSNRDDEEKIKFCA